MIGRGLIAAALLGLCLAACGDDETATPTPDSLAGSPQDPCRLLSQSDAARLINAGDLQPGVPAAEDECSFSNPDDSASLVFDLESRQLFDLALGDAQRQRAVVQPVKGLGDQAFYYTRGAGGSSPGPTGTPITYLKLRRGSTYLTVLVRKGQRYDQALERRVAEELIRRT